jgi:hypothetical protein
MSELSKLLSSLDCDHLDDFMLIVKKRMEILVRSSELMDNPRFEEKEAAFKNTPYYPYFETLSQNAQQLMDASKEHLKHSQTKENRNKRLSS